MMLTWEDSYPEHLEIAGCYNKKSRSGSTSYTGAITKNWGSRSIVKMDAPTAEGAEFTALEAEYNSTSKNQQETRVGIVLPGHRDAGTGIVSPFEKGASSVMMHVSEQQWRGIKAAQGIRQQCSFVKNRKNKKGSQLKIIKVRKGKIQFKIFLNKNTLKRIVREEKQKITQLLVNNENMINTPIREPPGVEPLGTAGAPHTPRRGTAGTNRGGGATTSGEDYRRSGRAAVRLQLKKRTLQRVGRYISRRASGVPSVESDVPPRASGGGGTPAGANFPATCKARTGTPHCRKNKCTRRKTLKRLTRQKWSKVKKLFTHKEFRTKY